MDLELRIEGTGPVEEAADLTEWLRLERISGVTDISQREKPPAPGEQGPTLLSIIGLVLGAKATVELVRSIHRWIETRKRNIKINIEHGDKKVVVDCANPDDVEALISSLSELFND